MPTPSRRQRRRREAGSEGSLKANPCTEEHEPHKRRGDLGEPAKYGEARRPPRGRQVDAAAVGGKRSFLSGEVSLESEMPGHHVRRVEVDRRSRKALSHQGEVSRGHSTGGEGGEPGRAERTSRGSLDGLAEEVMTAANLRDGAFADGQKVKPDASRRGRSLFPATPGPDPHPALVTLWELPLPRKPRPGAQARRGEPGAPVQTA